MKHVGIKQARDELPALVDAVEAGEQFVITRNGQPVAQLVPALREPKTLPDLSAFRRGQVGNSTKKGTPAATMIRRDRDER